MQLIANENVPRLTVEALRAAGHDILWARTDMAGSRDEEVLSRAQAEGRIVLTHDKDFGDLVFHQGQKASHGIVLFRIPMTSPAEVARIVVSVLARWTTGAAVRMQSNGDSYYAAGFDNNNYSTADGSEKCRIWKYVNHAPTSLAVDAGCHIAAGDTLRLEVRGTTLRLYQNGVLKLTAIDASLTGGGPGFEFAHDVDGSRVLDDWAGADLPP